MDLNSEVKELGDDFDYRDKLRDEKWVRDVARTIFALYVKLVNRGSIKPFGEEWKERPPI